ncbi:MAG: phosphatidylglycerophosphatase A [bacterium]|nr:phosphatidylglycerophosphatase A [bacterium]
MSPLLLAWAQGLGLGRLPVAPGTWGSLLAFPLWWLTGGAASPPLALAVMGVALLALGWAACEAGERAWGHDPSRVVADEVAGQWLTLVVAAPTSWLGCGAAFLLFRLFDIWKPCWVDRLQRLPGGLGVMADDLLAGLLAGIILRVVGLWAA